MNRMKNNKQKVKKRYRLYCPRYASDYSGKGYDTFYAEYIKGESDVIEHLQRFSNLMCWYQIVDLENEMKVINDRPPENN